MIAEKRRPSPCRLRGPRSFPHPAQHGSLRDVEAQHFEFTMNARRAPGRVLCDHAKDEFAQFPVDASSSHASPMPREPRPIQLEPGPMPANNGLRLYEDQRPLPSRPEPPQYHPEPSFRSGKSRLRMPSFQNNELLPKSQVFQKQVVARTDRSNEQDEQEPQRARHESVVSNASLLQNQSAVGFASMLDGEDEDRVAEVVEAHMVVGGRPSRSSE